MVPCSTFRPPRMLTTVTVFSMTELLYDETMADWRTHNGMDIQAGEGNVNLTPVIQGLSGLYIISSENRDINARLAKDVHKFINSGTYELLMEAKEDGEKVTMYTCGDEKTVTSFVLLADEGDELTFICLDGKLDRGQLEELLAEQMK